MRIAFPALAAALLLAACQQLAPPATIYDRVPNVPGEVLYHDVLLERVPADQLRVFGIGLGATEEEVRALHGTPRLEEEYVFGRIRNLEYAFGPGNETSVLYHLERGVVTGILLTDVANPLLVGESVLNHSRADVYGLLGQPTRIEDLHLQQLLYYDALGYEVYFAQKKTDRIYFTAPDRGIVPAGQKKADEVFCAQVVTPAVDPRTGECIAFATPCDVPTGWELIESCA